MTSEPCNGTTCDHPSDSAPFDIPAGHEYPHGYAGTPAQLLGRASAIATEHGPVFDARLELVAFARATCFPHDSDHDIAPASRSTLMQFDSATLASMTDRERRMLVRWVQHLVDYQQMRTIAWDYRALARDLAMTLDQMYGDDNDART